MITDRDPKPENDPAISRAPTPNMPADRLEALLVVERLEAEQRRRAGIQANTLAPRPSRGRR